MNWSRKLFTKDSERSMKESFISKDQNSLKAVERVMNNNRDFTSFGSKMPTTPSTSKRSSNDWDKDKRSGIIEENNEEYYDRITPSSLLNKGNNIKH